MSAELLGLIGEASCLAREHHADAALARLEDAFHGGNDFPAARRIACVTRVANVEINNDPAVLHSLFRDELAEFIHRVPRGFNVLTARIRSEDEGAAGDDGSR